MDLDLISEHRVRMFLEAGTDPDAVSDMVAPFQLCLEKFIRSFKILSI